MKPPFSIYRYASASEYLQDSYEWFHARDPGFSYDSIARNCAFKSRTYARNLIKGSRDAKNSDLRSLAAHFGLDADETQYMIDLAAFQTCGGGPAAHDLFQRLVAMQKRHAPDARPFREIEAATSLLHMTLLSVHEIEDGPREPEAIVRFLKGRFSAQAIESAIEDLVSTGFLVEDGERSGLRSAGKHLKKYDFNANYFLSKFHLESLEIARDALVREAVSERYLVGSSFVVNSKVFPRIVQKLNTFIEQLMALEGVAGGSDTVVQLNFQLMKMGAVPEVLPDPGLAREPARECVVESVLPSVIASAPGDFSRTPGVL